MKKFLLSAVSFVALGMAAPASAADMAVKAPPPAPLPVIYNWSGFYIGANGGWGTERRCFDAFIGGVFVGSEGCHDASGGVVGGQIVYRWQTGGWVFGLEAQDAGPIFAAITSASYSPHLSIGPGWTHSAYSPDRWATPGTTLCSTLRAALRWSMTAMTSCWWSRCCVG